MCMSDGDFIFSVCPCKCLSILKLVGKEDQVRYLENHWGICGFYEAWLLWMCLLVRVNHDYLCMHEWTISWAPLMSEHVLLCTQSSTIKAFALWLYFASQELRMTHKHRAGSVKVFSARRNQIAPSPCSPVTLSWALCHELHIFTPDTVFMRPKGWGWHTTVSAINSGWMTLRIHN